MTVKSFEVGVAFFCQLAMMEVRMLGMARPEMPPTQSAHEEAWPMSLPNMSAITVQKITNLSEREEFAFDYGSSI